MIDLTEILSIHHTVIENFGGLKGVRDEGGLISAVNRPYQTFDGQELYPSPIEKGAAIFESLILNHPFLDGNKRTAYILMRLTLMDYNLDIKVNEMEKYDFVMKAARGESSFEEIKHWINQNHITI